MTQEEEKTIAFSYRVFLAVLLDRNKIQHALKQNTSTLLWTYYSHKLSIVFHWIRIHDKAICIRFRYHHASTLLSLERKPDTV
jgi:hypothetical protein